MAAPLVTDPTLVPDRVRVHPGSLVGAVRVPGDKSISHRALIIGAMVGAPVAVAGLAASGDVAATAGALRTLGASLDLHADADDRVSGTVAGPVDEPDDILDCGNAGTALRLLAGVAAGIPGVVVLTGDASLRRRPVDRVATPLRAMGAEVVARGGGRLPPLVVRGGGLRGIRYDSPVASAQVKSSILLAGLRADGPTEVRSPLRSRDHTERLLAYLGVPVEREELPDGQEIVRLVPSALAERSVTVPGDPSSAAFWLVAAAAGEGSAVTLPGLCVNPTRLGALAVLRDMGAGIEVTAEPDAAGEPVGTVRVGSGDLSGASLAGAATVDALDELPVLALAGALSGHGLEVADASELRVKESDRISALVAALRAVGVEVETRADGFRVPGRQRPRGGTVDAGGDHRIAMTAAVAGLLSDGPVEISGFASVATSYPRFLADLRALGGSADVLATTTAPAPAVWSMR